MPMSLCRSQWWAASWIVWVIGALLFGCSGRKQVPFGLESAGGVGGAPQTRPQEHAPEYPAGQVFGPSQVEVPVGEAALVLQSGYALGALPVDLDGSEPLDALVVSADPQAVRLQAAQARGLGVVAKEVDSFLVPGHCVDPKAELRQLSSTLASVEVEHACETGRRTNVWLVTIEAQPRVRERITVLPPNERSTQAIELDLRTEDRDADGYEDIVADVRIGDTELPFAWLDRPGGFARDPSQPEEALQSLADEAWTSLDRDLAGARKSALSVLDAFIALCRESGAARIGLSGTQGLQCQHSAAAARAVSVAIVAAIRGGSFVRALELQRWWESSAAQPTPEERELVQTAWRRAKASTPATWRLIDTESSTAGLHFIDSDTLVIDAGSPRKVEISTGQETRLSATEIVAPIRSPDGRFAVRSVRVTCAGFEAELGPALGRQTHRALIQRRPGTIPCRTPIDRAASAFEWAVLGWAPQGLLAASGDMLRVIPLNERAKPAGRPIDLKPGSPLPAPIRGARITPDGSRYVIPHAEGIVVRDWRRGGTGSWLRPADWDAIPGELRSVAISPDGRSIALQKGNEVRLLSW